MDWYQALPFEQPVVRPYLHSDLKRIHTKAPDDFVTLGKLSFHANIETGVNYRSHNAQLTLHLYKCDQSMELRIKLEVKQESQNKKPSFVTFQRLLLPIDIKQSEIELFYNYYWVLVVNKIFNHTLFIDVGVTADKFPIPKATLIVEWSYKKNYEAYKYLVMDKAQYDDDFFKELKKFQKNVLEYDEERKVFHDKLLPYLRPYQCKAVQWMISRECGEFQIKNTDWIQDVVHEFKSLCGETLWYYIYTKVLSNQLFELGKHFRGGILADEMGLGKTVVVIALILNNPRNINLEDDDDKFLMAGKLHKEVEEVEDEPLAKRMKKFRPTLRCLCGNDPTKCYERKVQCPECLNYQHRSCVDYHKNLMYFCPPCWLKQKPIKSNGTLIVAPTAIFNQWLEEINKHVSEEAWKKGVYMYSGVKKKFIQPSVLSSFDIVITTYKILAADFGFTTDEKPYNLRYERKYIRECSPITRIQWWRVCLDEAQMVEFGINCNITSKMAKLIPAVNHWSVTGTPMRRSVNDLFYLINWFGIEPFNDQNFWDNCMPLPFSNGNKTPLLSLFSQIFWRNSKDEVAAELSIPEQRIEYHTINFAPVEQNLYMREHAAVLETFMEQINYLGLDLNRTLDSLSKFQLEKVFSTMLKVRKTCSHHLAACFDDIKTLNKINNVIMQKRDQIDRSKKLAGLLDYLKTKTKMECEEALRCHFTSLNNLAGTCYTSENWVGAVECYQNMLSVQSVTAEYEYKIRLNIFSQVKNSILRIFPEILVVKISKETDIDYLKDCLQQLQLSVGWIGGDAKETIEKRKMESHTEEFISEFKKKLGMLCYLENLNKEERKSCPICFADIEAQWCLLQCGHSYCKECTLKLLRKNNKIFVDCPMCREKIPISNIGVVDGREKNYWGNHSSKINAIVKNLLELKTKDPSVKVLIFSKWEMVLIVLKEALKQNGVNYRRLPGKNDDDNKKILCEFKDPEMGITALLLPYSWGCKGLNLVEATHVFLVEPILNPTEELQAIGRVHRMGQTKETVVHKFLMKGTIEEGIDSATSKAKDKWQREAATLMDLKNLFDMS